MALVHQIITFWSSRVVRRVGEMLEKVVLVEFAVVVLKRMIIDNKVK